MIIKKAVPLRYVTPNSPFTSSSCRLFLLPLNKGRRADPPEEAYEGGGTISKDISESKMTPGGIEIGSSNRWPLFIHGEFLS
jgi:hypothetical protein